MDVDAIEESNDDQSTSLQEGSSTDTGTEDDSRDWSDSSAGTPPYNDDESWIEGDGDEVYDPADGYSDETGLYSSVSSPGE